MSYYITFVKKIYFDDRIESVALICCLVDLIQFSYGTQFVLKNGNLQESKYLWECAGDFFLTGKKKGFFGNSPRFFTMSA